MSAGQCGSGEGFHSPIVRFVLLLLLFCWLGESGAAHRESLCVLHLRASVALFVYSGTVCYIDVARNRDESGHGRVRLSISRCSFVIAFRNLVGVYHSMARRDVYFVSAACVRV
jgi:hypothetical protein